MLSTNAAASHGSLMYVLLGILPRLLLHRICFSVARHSGAVTLGAGHVVPRGDAISVQSPWLYPVPSGACNEGRQTRQRASRQKTSLLVTHNQCKRLREFVPHAVPEHAHTYSPL